MAIRVALNHRTRYQYARDVWLSPQIVRLRPAPHTRTPIVSYSLKIKPAEHFINWQQDPYANHLARLVFPKKTREFEVEIDLVAEMTVINPFDFFLEPHAELFPFEYQPDVKKELAPYLEKSDASPKLAALVNELRQQNVPIVNFLVALNAKLQSVVGYTIRLEPGIQTPEETLTLRTGSCRDSAWLFVQMLRQYGLAARFVSGYLIQLKADVQAIDGPSGASADFCDLHAWTEVYLPGAGWIGFDPDIGPDDRRGPHPAGVLGRTVVGGGDLGRVCVRQRGDRQARHAPTGRPRRRAFDGRGWRQVRIPHGRHAAARRPARHQAVHR